MSNGNRLGHEGLVAVDAERDDEAPERGAIDSALADVEGTVTAEDSCEKGP